jgi:integrase
VSGATADLDTIPAELRDRPQWVGWRHEVRDGKPTKVPRRPGAPSRNASSTDPATWASFEDARATVERGEADGIGYVFAAEDPYTGGVDKIPKGKKVRSVPMTPAVIDALAALKNREHFTEDGDLVFCSEVGDYLDHDRLRKRYYAALDRAGLRRVRFHDLRHAFGTAAIAHLDAYSVQSYMGHAHYSTTQRYLHHKPRREDAAALAEAFSASGHPEEASRVET